MQQQQQQHQPAQQQQQTQHPVEDLAKVADKWEELRLKASEMMRVEDNIEKVLSERTIVKQRVDEMAMEVAVEEAKLQAVHDILTQTYESEKAELSMIEAELSNLTKCKEQLRETDKRVAETSSAASQLLTGALTKATEILNSELDQLRSAASSMNKVYNSQSWTSQEETIFITDRLKTLLDVRQVSASENVPFSDILKFHELVGNPTCDKPITTCSELFEFATRFDKFSNDEGDHSNGFEGFSKRLNELNEILLAASNIPQIKKLIGGKLDTALEILDHELRHSKKQERFDLEHDDIMKEKEKEITAEVEKQNMVKAEVDTLLESIASKREAVEKLTSKLTTAETSLQAAQKKVETSNKEIADLKKQEQDTYAKQQDIVNEREAAVRKGETQATENERRIQEVMQKHQQAVAELNTTKMNQSLKTAENLPMKISEEQSAITQLKAIESALLDEQTALTFTDVMVPSNLADSATLPASPDDDEIIAKLATLETQLQEKIKSSCGERARKSEDDRKQWASRLEILFKEGDERMKKIEKLQAQVNTAESITY